MKLLSTKNVPCVYKIYCTKNGVFYIGSTKRPYNKKANGKFLKGRYGQHLRKLKNKNHNFKLQTSWNKFGKTNFVFEFIKEFPITITQNELLAEEQKFLDLYFTDIKCANISPNATKPTQPNGYKHNKNTKEKIRKSLLGHEVLDSTRKKIKISLLGSVLNEETKNKMSISHQGKIFSAKHKENMSKSKIGGKNPMFGKTGKKSPASKYQPFILTNNKTQEKYKFEYIFEAVKSLTVSRTNLLAVLHGRRKSVNGFSAMFLPVENIRVVSGGVSQ